MRVANPALTIVPDNCQGGVVSDFKFQVFLLSFLIKISMKKEIIPQKKMSETKAKKEKL